MKELESGTPVKLSSGETGEIITALYNWKEDITHYLVRVQTEEGEKEVKFQACFVEKLEE